MRLTNLIITTAAIPGKQAPNIVTNENVQNMNPGSVIIDLAGESGGNCELGKYGDVEIHNGVIIDKPNIFLRTPLGGFINHVSEDPNCVLVRDITFTNLFFIMAIKHIKSGEELTITYQSYNPEEE